MDNVLVGITAIDSHYNRLPHNPGPWSRCGHNFSKLAHAAGCTTGGPWERIIQYWLEVGILSTLPISTYLYLPIYPLI